MKEHYWPMDCSKAIGNTRTDAAAIHTRVAGLKGILMLLLMSASTRELCGQTFVVGLMVLLLVMMMIVVVLATISPLLPMLFLLLLLPLVPIFHVIDIGQKCS